MTTDQILHQYRIGKGEGFADLEFALAAGTQGGGGCVTDDTVVVTSVHECQVCFKILSDRKLALQTNFFRCLMSFLVTYSKTMMYQ